MKKFFIFAFAALAAVTLFSCDKEEDDDASDLKEGQVMFDGKVYDVQCYARFEVNDSVNVVVFNAFAENFADSLGGFLDFTVGGDILDKKVDLTNPLKNCESLMFNVVCADSKGEVYFACYAENGEIFYFSNLGDQKYGQEEKKGSCFKSGTLTAKYNEKQLSGSVKLDGVLVNGTKVAANLRAVDQSSLPPR